MHRPGPQVMVAEADLGDVFELHAPRVYGFLRKRCGSDRLAEDLTAASFEAASKRFAAGHGHEVTLPWLLTVARRRLIDHWRRESRREERLAKLRTEMLVAGGGADAPTDVEAVLGTLAPKQRAVLMLRYLDDLSVSEVADEMQLTYKATESLLSRARKAFSTAYQERER